MHTIRFRLARIVGCAMLVLFVFATTAFAQKASGKASAGSEHVGRKRAEIAKLWAAEEMKWQDDTALLGVKYVLLWGNPRTGEHGMLRKFAAGFAPPPPHASVGGAGHSPFRNNRSAPLRLCREEARSRFILGDSG
jgi:hypothetical protein